MKENDSNMTIYQYGNDYFRLPIHTQRLDIYFGIEQIKPDTKCYFDNITLNINQTETN